MTAVICGGVTPCMGKTSLVGVGDLGEEELRTRFWTELMRGEEKFCSSCSLLRFLRISLMLPSERLLLRPRATAEEGLPGLIQLSILQKKKKYLYQVHFI